MEISKLSMGSIKRTNQVSRRTLKRLESIKKKIEALTEEYNQGVAEYQDIESWVVKKYGFYSEQILDGSADAILAQREADAAALASNTEEVEAVEEEVAPSTEPDPFQE